MMYKGKVLEVQNDFAIVLTNSMEYLKVKKKVGLSVGNQILFIEDDIYKENSINYKNVLSYAAILVVMLLSLSFITNFSTINNFVNGTAAIVSLDINPSIELKVNSKHKVIKATPLNRDAQEIFSEGLKGLDIEEAVFILIQNAREKQYLTSEKNSILISTIAIKDSFVLDKENLEKRIADKLEEDHDINGLQIAFMEGNNQDVKEAKKQNLSIGKYQIYKNTKEDNQKITVDEIRTMKVQDIIDRGIGHVKVEKVEKKVKNIKPKEQKQNQDQEKRDNKELEEKDKEKDKEDHKGKGQSKDEMKPMDNENFDNGKQGNGQQGKSTEQSWNNGNNERDEKADNQKTESKNEESVIPGKDNKKPKEELGNSMLLQNYMKLKSIPSLKNKSLLKR